MAFFRIRILTKTTKRYRDVGRDETLTTEAEDSKQAIIAAINFFPLMDDVIREVHCEEIPSCD